MLESLLCQECKNSGKKNKDLYALILTLSQSERPKLYTILAFLSAIGLNHNHLVSKKMIISFPSMPKMFAYDIFDRHVKLDITVLLKY